MNPNSNPVELFSARNITKQFANHRALDKVSIDVREGSIFGLLGPNGAGKTTLIRIINQIIAQDEGELFFHGKHLLPSDTENIGYLPEERGLYKKMTVGEQSLYLAQLKGLSKKEAMKRLNFWFEKFEIRTWWNRKVEELSKGMQQKVQFLITIIHQPSLLIFDEPFSGFDPINTNMMKEEILDLKAKGATIIFSTHNMASVEELCDDIALINNSRVILNGHVKEIKKRFKTNSFEVSFDAYEGDIQSLLPESFHIMEQVKDFDYNTAKVQIPSGGTPNDLLKALIPKVIVYSLNEIIPSMNEIFIRSVTQQNISSSLQN